MNDTYQPISCSQHDRLELAALRRQWLVVRVSGATVRLLARDVFTLDGAEWLRAETETGDERILRLDPLQF